MRIAECGLKKNVLPHSPFRISGGEDLTTKARQALKVWVNNGPAAWGLFLFLLFFLSPFSLSASEDPRVQNLRDISAFRLVVETLTPDARQAGINEERIRSQVAANFKVSLPRIALVEKEGPSIYIRIVLHKRKNDDLYYGSIILSVDRAVMILSPKGDFPAFSQVWEKTAVFSGKDPLLGTFEILSKMLTLLIEDFKSANP